MTIKIFIADDHRILREGLRSMIEMISKIQVVGEAGNGREAVRLATERRPDVVIMDVNMPDLNGIEATRLLLKELPAVKVIGLSMYSDKRFVAGMLKAGASGYLLKAGAFEELATAVQTVMAGDIYLSPRVTGVVIEDYVGHLTQEKSALTETLSPREREILQLLAEGKSSKDIASLLNVSEKTVHTHRQHIMEKLNLHSIAELTKYAIREGITTAEN
ncbi:MAG: response regulator transcription factor [Deltaproteobacteria bacterium]